MLQNIDVNGSTFFLLTNDNPEAQFTEETTTFLVQKLSQREIQNSIKEVIAGGDKEIILDEGIYLEYINAGMYSIVYRLVIDDQEYIMKFANSEMQSYVNYSQEMTRMDQLNKELGEFLKQYNIFIPNYNFATVNMCCRQMINGRQLKPQEAPEILNLIESELDMFVERKKAENPGLWNSTLLDLRDKSGDPSGNNFMRDEDGRIYLIDPFTN